MGGGLAGPGGLGLLWAYNLGILDYPPGYPVRGSWSRWGKGAREIQIPKLIGPLAIPYCLFLGFLSSLK